MPSKRTQQRGLDTRRELMCAALIEFAAVGFEAASTRAIAGRAGIKQGQLTYHFETKDELWRATVSYLFERFDEEFAAAIEDLGVTGTGDVASAVEVSVRALVRVVSRLPELNRVMIHSSTADSGRLEWLVDSHVRPRFEELSAVWQQVLAEGATHLEADPLVIYYCVLGAASLLYVNAPEAAQLAGSSGVTGVVTEELVEAHSNTIVAMLLGPRGKFHKKGK
jgi:AcrR family transcriptional regulator